MIDRDILQKLFDAGTDPSLLIQLVLQDKKPEAAATAEAMPVSDPPTPPAEVPAPAGSAPLPDIPQVGEQKEKPALSLDIDPKPDPVLTAIRELTGAIQASNIINRSRDYQAPETVEEAADKALAQILSGRK